jgi:arsenate reductase
MAVVIWHNPKCSTSRKVLELLQAKGAKPQVVDYLKTPPSRAELTALLARMGARPEDIVRRRGNDELLEGNPTGKTLLDLMVEHPILIERPIVQTPKGAAIGRPPEKALELL